jgi:uncharacterized Zn finger protein (UPF0148 family)
MPRLLPYRCPDCGDQLILWHARTGETVCPSCTRFLPTAAPSPATADRQPPERPAPDRRRRPAA